LVAALVVSIALAAAFGALWFRARNPSAEQAGKFLTTQKPAVTSVARDVGTKLLNYDSTTIEGISKQMLAEATGSFFDDYQKAMQQGLKSALEKAKASSRGQILQGPDVSFQTPSVAVALLRVNQTTQSSGNPGGQSISYYLKITLVDTVDGGWKAEQVDVLSQQANQPPVPTG
jgi:hypothetical protein